MTFASIAEAAITATLLTPATPTILSNGRAYYCAGVQYTFRIQSTDPDATGAAYWNTIVLQFRENGAVRENCTISIPGLAATVENGVVVDNVQNLSGIYTNIDIRVTLRFLWNSTPFNAAIVNDVRATASNSGGATAFDTSTRAFNYGVVSQIQVVGFAQDADAADAMVNPWHDGFNVTGRIAYYYPGELISNLVPAAEISALTLYRQVAVPAGPLVTFSGATNNFQYAVPADYFAFGALTAATATTGGYTWSITATMATGPATEPASSGTLGITVGMVSVNGLTFLNGGGVNNPPQLYYVRSVNVTGTELRLATTAVMVGTATFGILDSLGNTYTLQVANGATAGTVLLGATPTPVQVTAGSNTNVTYTVQSVTGGVYGNTNPANGQNAPGRILNSSGYACRWENGHWPGYGSSPFTAPVGVPTSTATSFRLQWTALSAANAAPYDADFFSYRVYFRRVGDPTWRMLDQSNTPALGAIGAGTIAFDVGGVANPLEPLTNYEYQVSAIDVFGNEVPAVNRITGTVQTTAFTVEAKVTDGISAFDNMSFSGSPINPLNHVLRKTAIKVTVYLVTAGTAPEQVNIVIARNDSDLPAQYGLPAGANDDIVPLVEGTTKWTIPCVKVTANTYEALIPSTHSLVTMNTNVRFIVQSVIGGVSSYYDHTPDAAPPGDWWSDEWRFRIAQPAIFFPWPTRVLNNVLTSAIPCCWPAYFLTVDSLVTIKVYDIKGRVINIIAEKMYRPGGQNIKENGWCGTNKDNRRVGPGLYYIHIKATTFGGKVTLDKMLKVVVAH